MEAPIPFIMTTGGDGNARPGFSVNPDALELLRSEAYSGRYVVSASVVGQYRTGKSFLMNLLLGKTSGFPLGSAVVAKTKGVWMWMADHPGK